MQRIFLLASVLGALIISWYSEKSSANYWDKEYVAECFIDPDNFFGDNEEKVTELRGEMSLMLEDCIALAQMKYRNNYSVALKEVRPSREPKSWEHTGVCHIDSDKMVDFGVLKLGIVYGDSLIALFEECSRLASITYPFGSYGVSNINQDRELDYSRKAECWIDNDASFDQGNLFVGHVYGDRILDLVEDCKFAAQVIFKSPSSAGLENIE